MKSTKVYNCELFFEKSASEYSQERTKTFSGHKPINDKLTLLLYVVTSGEQKGKTNINLPLR